METHVTMQTCAVIKHCRRCKDKIVIHMTLAEFKEYTDQNIFPDMPNAERNALSFKICIPCQTHLISVWSHKNQTIKGETK